MEYVLVRKRKYENSKLTVELTQNNNVVEATIYDPYYCAGRAAKLLNDVFQQRRLKQSIAPIIRIQHEKRDFYRDILRQAHPS